MTLPYLYTPAESMGKIVIGKKGKTSSLPGSTRIQLSLRNTFWFRSETGTDKTPWSGMQGRGGAAPCDCQRKPDQDSLAPSLKWICSIIGANVSNLVE